MKLNADESEMMSKMFHDLFSKIKGKDKKFEVLFYDNEFHEKKKKVFELIPFMNKEELEQLSSMIKQFGQLIDEFYSNIDSETYTKELKKLDDFRKEI